MRTFKYKITDSMGIHARPAGILVKEAKKYASSITITKDDKSTDIKRLMMLMGMGIKHGDEVIVSIEGEDEELAAAELEIFFKENL